MDEIITEKNYPIQKLWVFKSMGGTLSILVLVVFLFLISFQFSRTAKESREMNFYFILMIGLVIFEFLFLWLKRANFHYSIKENFLTLKQGILVKQQRHIPYGVIQNVLLRQDLLDKFLGLASLTIENASQGGGVLVTRRPRSILRIVPWQRQPVERLGFRGNQVNISGLSKENAETLKKIILQKMKKNPIEDSQSGL